MPKKLSLQPRQSHSAPGGAIHTTSETQSFSGEEESIGAEATGEEGGSTTCHNPTQEGHGEEVLSAEDQTRILMSGEDSTTRSIVLIVMEGLSGAGREKQKVFPSEKQDERVQQYLTNNIELFHQNTGPPVTVCPFMTRYIHKMIAFNGSEYKQAGVCVKIYSLQWYCNTHSYYTVLYYTN